MTEPLRVRIHAHRTGLQACYLVVEIFQAGRRLMTVPAVAEDEESDDALARASLMVIDGESVEIEVPVRVTLYPGDFSRRN